jgi:hypothetical protein
MQDHLSYERFAIVRGGVTVDSVWMAVPNDGIRLTTTQLDLQADDLLRDERGRHWRVVYVLPWRLSRAFPEFVQYVAVEANNQAWSLGT